MKVIIEDSAKKCLNDIYYYNMQYSSKNAIETDLNIIRYIQGLEDFPYIGKYIPEMSDDRFREIIYKKTRQSIYRIMYYISEITNTIYIINIISSKQDFKCILKLHNYFNNYFKF